MKVEKFGKYLYPVFRIVVGLMFFTHGASKILGWFGGSSLSIFSMMGFVGLMEILIGLSIAVGFFTRFAAFGGIVLMVSAYFKVHLPNGILPMSNGGELAILYLVIFLVILSFGAKNWSLENKIFGKEVF